MQNNTSVAKWFTRFSMRFAQKVLCLNPGEIKKKFLKKNSRGTGYFIFDDVNIKIIVFSIKWKAMKFHSLSVQVIFQIGIISKYVLIVLGIAFKAP